MKISKSKLSKICLVAGFIFSAQMLFATDVIIRKDDDPSPVPATTHGPVMMIPVSATVNDATLAVFFDWSLGNATITVYDAQNQIVYQGITDTYSTMEEIISVDSWESGDYTIKITYGTTHLIGEFKL
ncbi:MAG: DUF3244 domain-containing protein [Paludibacter sp.]|nr:DUF3244 domain-containing protein [Paludibacter sp.]